MADVWESLPRDLVHKVLKYPCRLVYRRGRYIDIHKIATSDTRYSVVRTLILKKTDITRMIELSTTDNGFYFEFRFNEHDGIGLCYDYNFSYRNQFEICYVDMRTGWEQIRTYM